MQSFSWVWLLSLVEHGGLFYRHAGDVVFQEAGKALPVGLGRCNFCAPCSRENVLFQEVGKGLADVPPDAEKVVAGGLFL